MQSASSPFCEPSGYNLVAQQLHIAPLAVRNWLVKAGRYIPRSYQHLTPNQIELHVFNALTLLKHSTLNKVASELNLDYNLLHHWLSSRGHTENLQKPRARIALTTVEPPIRLTAKAKTTQTSVTRAFIAYKRGGHSIEQAAQIAGVTPARFVKALKQLQRGKK